METIFHEKQEGSLCAQHCLNALLQGSYFTPVDLATLAQRMDDEERIRMAESGYDSEEYRQFLEQPSGNMDDSGYFSVQVISSALEVWNLDLIPYNSTEPRATLAQLQPSDMQAFICNYRDHWFTIRKLGYQWFNLNSLLSGPELISNTYLAMFLAQLQQEGYSIFVVVGPLPANAADDVLRLRPATQLVRPTVNAAATMTDKDPQLERAIRMSLGQSRDSSDTDDLETALTMSLLDEDDEEQMRQALRLSLQADGEPDLQRALNMSLDVDSVTSTSCEMQLDPAEVRRRRLAFLDNLHTQDSPTTKLNT